MTQYMSYYIRSHGMTIGEATSRVALISGFAGASGTYLGGYLGSRVAERELSRTSRLAAWGFIVAAPLFAFGFLAPEPKLATALLMLGTAAQLAYFGPRLGSEGYLCSFDLAAHCLRRAQRRQSLGFHSSHQSIASARERLKDPRHVPVAKRRLLALRFSSGSR